MRPVHDVVCHQASLAILWTTFRSVSHLHDRLVKTEIMRSRREWGVSCISRRRNLNSARHSWDLVDDLVTTFMARMPHQSVAENPLYEYTAICLYFRAVLRHILHIVLRYSLPHSKVICRNLSYCECRCRLVANLRPFTSAAWKKWFWWNI